MLTFKKIARESVRFLKLRPKNQYALKQEAPPTYNQDGLISFHNCSFMQDPSFIAAYQRGIQAAGQDYKCHWRVHVALWVAAHAVKLGGAFVECGVNRGFISSSVMRYLNWNSLNRNFYLFDTFCGFDPAALSLEEKELNYMKKSKDYYTDCYKEAEQNFSEFKNVTLVRGSVPSTLTQVEIPKISYLSIDMNCVNPEIAAANYFWPKIIPGGMILLDDYAYGLSAIQKSAFDQFAREKSVSILSLPTGQGLIIKSQGFLE